MSASAEFRNNLLEHIFQNAACPFVGDANGLLPSATAGVLEISAHTADPGTTGDQTTYECAYTGYARVAVVRSDALWSVVANEASNLAAIVFPISTSGPETIKFIRVGSAHTGAGHVFLTASTADLVVNAGIIPRFDVGAVKFQAL